MSHGMRYFCNTFLQRENVVRYVWSEFFSSHKWVIFLGKPSKKKVDFFHTFKKVWIFRGWGGSWVQFPHFFVQFYFFLRILSYFIQFLWVGRSFSGWNWRKNFFPQNVFPHFRGGRGGVREVWKKSTLFIFFFEGFPKTHSNECMKTETKHVYVLCIGRELIYFYEHIYTNN